MQHADPLVVALVSLVVALVVALVAAAAVAAAAVAAAAVAVAAVAAAAVAATAASALYLAGARGRAAAQSRAAGRLGGVRPCRGVSHNPRAGAARLRAGRLRLVGGVRRAHGTQRRGGLARAVGLRDVRSRLACAACRHRRRQLHVAGFRRGGLFDVFQLGAATREACRAATEQRGAPAHHRAHGALPPRSRLLRSCLVSRRRPLAWASARLR